MPGRALAFGCLLLSTRLRDNRTAFVDALSPVCIPDLRPATLVARWPQVTVPQAICQPVLQDTGNGALGT